MKKLLTITAIGLLFVACGNGVDGTASPDQIETTLSLSTDQLFFEAAGGEQSVSITTNAYSWKGESASDWITVSQDKGTLKITVAQSQTPTSRTAIVYVQANSKWGKVEITQTAASLTSAPYSVGAFYSENGITGVVYKVSGQHGMVVSLTEGNFSWCSGAVNGTSIGCTDAANGANNLLIVKNQNNWVFRFPAFKWSNDLNTNGITGWYLPAIDELNDLYIGFTSAQNFNATLTNNGGVAIQNDGYASYWSSTEQNEEFAYRVNFASGAQTRLYKTYTAGLYVRGVHTF